MSGMQATLKNRTSARQQVKIPVLWLRRTVFLVLVVATMLTGIWLMFDILQANGTSILELSLLVLFAITFAWISVAFWSGALGFMIQLLRRDPLTLKQFKATAAVSEGRLKQAKTAIVMPVYNEDTERVMAGFEACFRSLEQTGKLAGFDFFLLSDTQDPELAEREKVEWQKFKHRLGASLAKKVFYRRRENNVGRKVGNLEDFCCRWGQDYAHMLVLDADSIMTGKCILRLTYAMHHNPEAGLIQTVPIPVRQDTFFARFLQFAASLYSPMLATGLAFWQGDAANYWGHNAIIRTRAFIDYCGLPPLTGKGPFSGDILSHDFVEAACLRRAGWQVLLFAELEGSYEEVPSNMLDYAVRDRRWVQGNIQHLALLPKKGFFWMSKVHFLLGALAYITSLVWLLMLALSTVDAVGRSLTSNDFFISAYQLFPSWKIAKTELIYALLYFTASLLLLPKLMGIIIALLYHRQAFGGTIRLLLSAMVETVFAILIAPIMMVFHAYFVVCVFAGKKVSWNSQSREGRMLNWREAFIYTRWATLVAVCWGAVAWYFAPVFFWWMLPVLLGLVLAAPILRYSSSLTLGLLFKKAGLFMIPAEYKQVPVIEAVAKHLQILRQQDEQTVDQAFQLPAERHCKMPQQNFNQILIQ
ncbi:glucans biosynthesis glucosyltransferase MdoH [Gayadomonas joobiniege]|uniref:glucans biosynthesis glucosyltransferase MdoH n=1 Tax=Gayadomonas joobiniege TaxID=1234606 RepID=UPI00036C2E56|nr:glucans biosynthesis glucosyltransferase MdoH [Gayadomonas joobiniege]